MSLPIIWFIEGYNGTIFTYGQTGSGKTHTICGTTSKEGKGIIPRSFELIFSTMDNKIKKDKIDYEVKFSYIEIYNEVGYDLLNLKRSVQNFNIDEMSDDQDSVNSDQPTNKVTYLFDKNGRVVLQNLTCHQVNNINDALDLINEGDLRRRISPTPMNIQSSRSHCICIIHLVQKSKYTSRVFKSKLNLVDLAGSERIWRSQVEKQTLSEARYINLSLHYLEHVIVTLSNSVNKVHVPYRNSMMTSLLKGSLGGNCVTAMIANIVLNNNCILESISTCRFAQRVAIVENRVKENWYLDPQQELVLLRNQLALTRTRENEDLLLDENEIEECKDTVLRFLNDENSKIIMPRKRNQIKYCFELMKNAIKAKKETISENKRTNTDENFTNLDPVSLLTSLNCKMNLKDTKITMLIHNHQTMKIKFAASTDEKFIKKIRKLKWDAYEDLDTLKKISEDMHKEGMEMGGGDFLVSDSVSTLRCGELPQFDVPKSICNNNLAISSTINLKNASTNTTKVFKRTCDNFVHIVPCFQHQTYKKFTSLTDELHQISNCGENEVNDLTVVAFDGPSYIDNSNYRFLNRDTLEDDEINKDFS
ncbi:kinesin-like protein KIF6 [Daktulosphaira vitifoliae]|uniref:kinesin-like protein KIF6 n=1 Tax=Daktulosphaira vitifoliae TaxID=58002 RepID=UPI0021A9A7EF|nr:kinesin-like protein KIF6 [Daktulosphaira vitifoliae]